MCVCVRERERERECSGLATVRFLNNNSFSSWKEFSFNNFSEWLETNFLIASTSKKTKVFFHIRRDLNRAKLIRPGFCCSELFSNANKKGLKHLKSSCNGLRLGLKGPSLKLHMQYARVLHSINFAAVHEPFSSV